MRIEHYSFGSITIDGQTYRQDVKIISRSVVPNWWRKQGHAVAIEDIEDILSTPPAVLVLGKGDPGRMTPGTELVRRLEHLGIELIAQPTAQATETFNRLVEKDRDVAAGFHLTC